MDNTQLNIEILNLIKNKNSNSMAKDIFKDINIIDFLHEIEFGTYGNFSSSLQKISERIDKKTISLINTDDLLFILDNFDIQKLGTFPSNHNKNIYEYIYENIDNFKDDKINYEKIKEKLYQLNAPLDKGCHTDIIEIALNSDLVNSNYYYHIFNNLNLNEKIGEGFEGGTISIHKFLHNKDLIKKFNDLDETYLKVIVKNYQFNSDDLNVIFSENELNEKSKSIFSQAKENYLNQESPLNLVKLHIIEGYNSHLFSNDELKSMIDKYYNFNYETNFIDKEKQLRDFSRKGNLIISLTKKISGLSAILENKISQIESLPASETKKWNDNPNTGEVTTYVPNKEFNKSVDDDVLYYLLQKSEECLNNASDLTRDKSLDKSIVSSLIQKMRNNFTFIHGENNNKKSIK